MYLSAVISFPDDVVIFYIYISNLWELILNSHLSHNISLWAQFLESYLPDRYKLLRRLLLILSFLITIYSQHNKKRLVRAHYSCICSLTSNDEPSRRLGRNRVPVGETLVHSGILSFQLT